MIPRQRGIFSEILTTEDSKNLEVSFITLGNIDNGALSWLSHSIEQDLKNAKSSCDQEEGKTIELWCGPHWS